jgi:hypothetical protein
MDWKPSGVHPRLWVRVVQSLIFYVVFCSLVSCRPFFFLFVWNCIVVLRRCTASELYIDEGQQYNSEAVHRRRTTIQFWSRTWTKDNNTILKPYIDEGQQYNFVDVRLQNVITLNTTTRTIILITSRVAFVSKTFYTQFKSRAIDFQDGLLTR